METHWISYLKHLLLLVVLMCSLRLKGQEYVLSGHYTDANELPNNHITSIVSDKHGTLWFVCVGELMSYNGIEFKRHITDSAQALNNGLTASVVYTSPAGTIYFYNGKNYYEIGENQQVTWLQNKHNTHFSEDLHPRDFSTYQPFFSILLPRYQLHNLIKNKRNGYIMNNRSTGYFDYKRGGMVHNIPNGYTDVPRGFIYSNQEVYIIGQQQFTLKNGKLIRKNTPLYWNDTLIAPNSIRYIATGNNLFLAAIHLLGVFKISPSPTGIRLERLIPSAILPSFTNDEITFIHPLNDGQTIFVGTRLSGLYKYTKRLFTGYQHALPLPTSFNSILKLGNCLHTNNGVKWDLHTGKSDHSNLHFTTYGSDYVTDADHTPYFIRKWDFHTIKPGGVHPPVKNNAYFYYSTGVIDHHKLYGWNNSCLFVKDKQQITRLPFTLNDSAFLQFPNTFRVHCVFVFHDTLWVGAAGGLHAFYHNTKLPLPLPLANNSGIRAIHRDPLNRGLLFFTYGSGVFLYTNGQFHQASAKSPPNLAYTHYLFIDQHNRVWLPTNRGMYCADYETWFRSFTDAQVTPYFFYLTTNDGLLSNELNGGTVHSYLYDSLTRKLYLSTVSGLAAFIPDSASLNIPNHPIHIQEVHVDDHKITGLSALPLSFNILKLKVTSPYFGHKENLIIEYRMPEASGSWVRLNSQNELYLTRGQPGWKTIELRYRNGLKESDYYHTAIHFEVAPLWYEKTVDQLLMLLLTIFLIWLTIRKRIESQRQKQATLQAIIAEQTRSLKHTLDELTASEENLRSAITVKEKLIRVLAHDMRSPLASTIFLTNHIQTMLKTIKVPAIHEPVGLLDKVIQSQHNILHYANDFLAWYNVTNNMVRLNSQHCELHEVIDEILVMYRLVIEQQSNRLIYSTTANRWVNTDRKILTIIIRNLIDNANKNTLSGTIEIQITQTNHGPLLRIINDARHCDQASLNALQETLNATNQQDTKDHKLGLILIKNLSTHLGLELSCTVVAQRVIVSIQFQPLN